MFGKAFVALTLAATVLAQSLQVNSPAALITCQPALLSWSGGKSPYFLSVIPGGQPSAAALKDFGSQSSDSYTWTVDIAAGTSVTVKIVDSDGNTNYAAPVTIQAGDTGCLNGSSSGSAAASGTSAASAASGAAGATSAAASAAATSAGSTASAAKSSAASAGSAATSGGSSAGAAAASGASSAKSGAASGASSVSGAAASASSTGAASPASIVNLKTGLLGAVLGAAGLLL